jgi:hypothetical protein
MVARDGIEPPTPAFSGPRSTTELPGLSADFRCIGNADSGVAGQVQGGSTKRMLATTWVVYQLAIARDKPQPGFYWSNGERYLLAMLRLTELRGISKVPTLCDASS